MYFFSLRMNLGKERAKRTEKVRNAHHLASVMMLLIAILLVAHGEFNFFYFVFLQSTGQTLNLYLIQ